VRFGISITPVRDAVTRLVAQGLDVPLVADIHFSPNAALEAAQWADKVRINPGNYADAKLFKVIEYNDTVYQSEVDRLEEKLAPVIARCKERDIAMRIGSNHGSLSDRIMNRYGDTPLGMVESALELVRICEKHGYYNLILSMKASNPKVMIESYRLLAARLEELGPDWNYPLHLGVTEAGERILRSAARACLRTGVPISTHHWAPLQVGTRQAEILLDAGAPPRLVCIGHSADSTDADYLESLLRLGVYLSMDRYPGREPRPDYRARNATVAELVRRGWAGRLMLGHDYGVRLVERGVAPVPPAQPTLYLFLSKTALPGLRFSELLPHAATWMHKAALVRTVYHDHNDHDHDRHCRRTEW